MLGLKQTPETDAERIAALRKYGGVVIKKLNKAAHTDTKGQTEISFVVDESLLKVSFTVKFICGAVGAGRFLNGPQKLTKNFEMTSNLVSEP